MTRLPRSAGPSDAAAHLAAWEAAAVVPAVARPAVLLAHLDDVAEAALDVPIGVCAAWSAAELSRVGGTDVDVVLTCAACAAELEITLDVEPWAAVPHTSSVAEEASVSTVSGEVSVRAPTTRDLLACRDTGNPVAALRARCLRGADRGELTVAQLAHLTSADLGRIDDAARELSGPAGAVIRTSCPACDADVVVPLDLGALWWEQTAADARRLLAEVAVLARAFGWGEDAVLALSPTRRATYLALAGEAGVP
ncbi:hypothetical protein Acsp06_43720 [Actinomycetospora sp. NBRC 106375]|uniref:hypothetical protein n=1 Tax=Actinomycetospora sp. NBRC 106375 TaxID=3032207 RepID=UPI0024A45775|nr:hypothetical protein [Actinomycetospora sp. NBRC 106375]GLZ48187.1 hypothetical protein Acsp06_43720 [Actinomycetospora sp. NBRC 106375]